MNAPSHPSSRASGLDDLGAGLGAEAPLDLRQTLMQLLQLEGCEPELDAERDLTFRLRGFHFCLRLFDDDPEFAQLVLPYFHTVREPTQLPRPLMLADRVNGHFKGVKIVSTQTDEGMRLCATVDFLVPDVRHVAPVLLRAAGCLGEAVQAFRLLSRLS